MAVFPDYWRMIMGWLMPGGTGPAIEPIRLDGGTWDASVAVGQWDSTVDGGKWDVDRDSGDWSF